MAQPQPLVPEPPPRSIYTNPHSRTGPYAEGDYQCLNYQPPGDVCAATVDDVSGKICLLVENNDLHQIVVLDYGWDFWKPSTNEEAGMRVPPPPAPIPAPLEAERMRSESVEAVAV